MRVVLGRLAVGGPAGVPDPGVARERFGIAAAFRGSSACPRRGGARGDRPPAWRRLRNHSRDIQAA